MLKKVTLAACAAAVLLASGCASVRTDSDGFDASVVSPFIKVNETTMKEVRAYLGTPTLSAEAADGSKVLGYGLVGHNTAGAFGRNFAKGAMTLGFGAKSYEYTVKSLLFKFNGDGVVTDYKTDGVSYVTKQRLTMWNECERRLTPQEINSPVTYGVSEICEEYAKDVAAKENIAVDKVDTGKEFPFCNIACQTTRHAVSAFGELKNVITVVDKEDGDGSKEDLIFK